MDQFFAEFGGGGCEAVQMAKCDDNCVWSVAHVMGISMIGWFRYIPNPLSVSKLSLTKEGAHTLVGNFRTCSTPKQLMQSYTFVYKCVRVYDPEKRIAASLTHGYA